MIYLIAYDISDDRIRSKVAKRLIAVGYERIQLSVFTGLKHPKANKSLWQDLTTWLQKEATAKCYIFKIPKSHFKNMDIIGTTHLDLDYLTGTKHSFFC